MHLTNFCKVAFLVVALIVAVRCANTNDNDNPTASTEVTTKKGVRSFNRRVKEAGHHLSKGLTDGPGSGPMGLVDYGKSALHGAKHEAQKTRSRWQEKQYAKAAGHATLVAARPLAAVVSSPVPLLTGLVQVGTGVSAAAGSMAKLGVDGSRKLIRGHESEEEKHERYVKNHDKLLEGNIKRLGMYETIGWPTQKISKAISGRKTDD